MLLHGYFNSLNFYKNGELSRNQTGRSGVQVKKEDEKFTVVCSRSPKNLEFGHLTLLFCRGRQRNVPKCRTHVQSDCFGSLSCCRGHRRSIERFSIAYTRNANGKNDHVSTIFPPFFAFVGYRLPFLREKKLFRVSRLRENYASISSLYAKVHISS